MPSHTSGQFSSTNWREHPAGQREEYPNITRASVTNTFIGGIQATETSCEYTIVYVAERTGTFTGIELLTGSVDGRTGSFAIEERGTFDADGTLHCAFEVVLGSGTGELHGLRGTGRFTAKQGEPAIPFTFEYDLT